MEMDTGNSAIAIPREPPVAGGEVDTLLGELERLRRYLAWKCGNLDSAGLRATHPPSGMTLGGLLKHLAGVEDDWRSARRSRRPDQGVGRRADRRGPG